MTTGTIRQDRAFHPRGPSEVVPKARVREHGLEAQLLAEVQAHLRCAHRHVIRMHTCGREARSAEGGESTGGAPHPQGGPILPRLKKFLFILFLELYGSCV